MTADTAPTCDGCDAPVAEGEHFMRLDSLQIDTYFEPSMRARLPQVEATTFSNLIFHTPGCFLRWCTRTDEIASTFGAR